MTAITSALSKVNIEEVSYGKSVSEYTNTKIGGSINYLIDNSIEPIGTVIDSFLTVAQFQNLKGNKWVRMEGQSIVGSDLATLTGITTLPDAVTNEAFLGQTSNEANISNYEASQNKSHSHIQRSDAGGLNIFRNIVSNWSGVGGLSGLKSPTSPVIANGDQNITTSEDGGTVARPNTIRVNKFIKINNDDTP